MFIFFIFSIFQGLLLYKRPSKCDLGKGSLCWLYSYDVWKQENQELSYNGCTVQKCKFP